MPHPAAGANSPLALLLQIEQRSRQYALGLPQQVEVRRTWSGIAFRVGGAHLVSALGEVREILEYPALTRVPGGKPWVRGIANVRGSLLPIMDMHGFLNGENSEIGRRTRVLVMHHGALAAGMVVDEVLGLRHFFDEEHTQARDGFGEHLAPYVRDVYRQAGTLWGVFSMSQLAADPQFLQVASA